MPPSSARDGAGAGVTPGRMIRSRQIDDSEPSLAANDANKGRLAPLASKQSLPAETRQSHLPPAGPKRRPSAPNPRGARLVRAPPPAGYRNAERRSPVDLDGAPLFAAAKAAWWEEANTRRCERGGVLAAILALTHAARGLQALIHTWAARSDASSGNFGPAFHRHPQTRGYLWTVRAGADEGGRTGRASLGLGGTPGEA